MSAPSHGHVGVHVTRADVWSWSTQSEMRQLLTHGLAGDEVVHTDREIGKPRASNSACRITLVSCRTLPGHDGC